jgi:hypothetical protein
MNRKDEWDKWRDDLHKRRIRESSNDRNTDKKKRSKKKNFFAKIKELLWIKPKPNKR